MADCAIIPLGKFGEPYHLGILSGCEWCQASKECFHIADRDYQKELQQEKERADEINDKVKQTKGDEQ